MNGYGYTCRANDSDVENSVRAVARTASVPSISGKDQGLLWAGWIGEISGTRTRSV
jgi:hypothetical protein